MNQTNPTRRPDEPIGFTVEGILSLAGGRPKVAAKFGLSYQTVAKWSRRIPSAYAREIAIMAGLPIEIVRPDHVHSVNPTDTGK